MEQAKALGTACGLQLAKDCAEAGMRFGETMIRWSVRMALPGEIYKIWEQTDALIDWIVSEKLVKILETKGAETKHVRKPHVPAARQAKSRALSGARTRGVRAGARAPAIRLA